jgi:hypothetical protein
MKGVAAEPQRHANHAIASDEKLTFSSDAFSGSFFVRSETIDRNWKHFYDKPTIRPEEQRLEVRGDRKAFWTCALYIRDHQSRTLFRCRKKL